MRRWRSVLLTAAACLAAWLGWEAAGWAAAAAGFGELDLPARLVGVFAVLTATETILARVAPEHP